MRMSRSPVEPGSTVDERSLTAVSGDQVAVPDPDRLTHIQFRRFAGCPVCNLHLRSVVRRHRDIEAAGVREVVVFHSPAEELVPHTTDLPFAVVADPARRLYAEFGVERSPRALLTPRAWGPVVRAVLSGVWNVVRRREHLPSITPHGGRLGLPADFLVAPDGRVLAAKYGEHVYDQWSVDELLELAARRDAQTIDRAADVERQEAAGAGAAELGADEVLIGLVRARVPARPRRRRAE